MDSGPQYTHSIWIKGPQYTHSIWIKGPQYISSIQKSVHNTLVQYGKKSTIYKFNMEKGPQYITSIRKRVHNILVQYREVSTMSVQYGKVSTIILVQYIKGSTIY